MKYVFFIEQYLAQWIPSAALNHGKAHRNVDSLHSPFQEESWQKLENTQPLQIDLTFQREWTLSG